ncbi:MAG: hypothetical protein AABY30_06325, partial [Candidatus Thermoplasmatota archaeon]
SPVEVVTPAGAFDAVPVEQENAPGIPFFTEWTIAVGFGRALMQYSADVGHLIKYEAFGQSGNKIGEVVMTSPAGRQPSSTGWALAVAAVSLAAAVAILVLLRRRKKQGRSVAYPPDVSSKR